MEYLQLRLGDVPDREYVRRLVEEQVDKLVRHTGNVTSCHVAIERPNEHPSSGATWRARIEVRLAGAPPFVVRREQGDGVITDDISKVIHDAFSSAHRKARELHRRMRGEKKVHVAQEIGGIVTELHEDYGALLSADGRRIYFHANSVIAHPFDELAVGMGVAFEEEAGDEGPQASSLRVVDGRHHPPRDERRRDVAPALR